MQHLVLQPASSSIPLGAYVPHSIRGSDLLLTRSFLCAIPLLLAPLPIPSNALKELQHAYMDINMLGETPNSEEPVATLVLSSHPRQALEFYKFLQEHLPRFQLRKPQIAFRCTFCGCWFKDLSTIKYHCASSRTLMPNSSYACHHFKDLILDLDKPLAGMFTCRRIDAEMELINKVATIDDVVYTMTGHLNLCVCAKCKCWLYSSDHVEMHRAHPKTCYLELKQAHMLRRHIEQLRGPPRPALFTHSRAYGALVGLACFSAPRGRMCLLLKHVFRARMIYKYKKMLIYAYLRDWELSFFAFLARCNLYNHAVVATCELNILELLGMHTQEVSAHSTARVMLKLSNAIGTWPWLRAS